MTLSAEDHTLITKTLGREPTVVETALFENLWSEHCAYRSSKSLLGSFTSSGEDVLVGPGDDAAIVTLTDDLYLAIGIESHNHPSYVDPYDGAATGIGGIVRDILSMGAYPIALVDSIYFGDFTHEHSRYLFEGVVEGIADYGNSIGVPTVGGSVNFHTGYEGNPLVNVGCIGLVSKDRLVTAKATRAGNMLVIVGNATGRDGLGGASFASEDLQDDAEIADRPAVQVGDPYAEKLLIEANEALLDAGVIQAARDLGAAGLGGATSEMVAKGGLGARIELDRLHQREPDMTAREILLAESQERMCYEVTPENIETVESIADRYDLGFSVVGEITENRYMCTFKGEIVTDVPVEFLVDGAPEHSLESTQPPAPEPNLPNPPLSTAFEAVIGSPNTADKRWVYRQYDHEVGIRTLVGPGDDSAILTIREADLSLALSSGANPQWTSAASYEGARAIGLENATNLAVKSATPLTAVNCLNAGNPEKPLVYGGFEGIVNGLADVCQLLGVPVVGGNVSLYNDSSSGAVPPTPTLFMVGLTEQDPPPMTFHGDGTIVLVGDSSGRLGGSEYLAQFTGDDQFPTLPQNIPARIHSITEIAGHESTLAMHDISHGGLAVTLAEMITSNSGGSITLDDSVPVPEHLFSETPGRVIIETTDPSYVRSVFRDIAPVVELGTTTTNGIVNIETSTDSVHYSFEELTELRSVIDRELS